MQCAAVVGDFIKPAACGPESLVLLTQTEYLGVDPSALGISAASVTEVFGWGLAAVLLMWSIGYGVSAAVTVIRKI